MGAGEIFVAVVTGIWRVEKKASWPPMNADKHG
jgi:hypothetical protein